MESQLFATANDQEYLKDTTRFSFVEFQLFAPVFWAMNIRVLAKKLKFHEAKACGVFHVAPFWS